tara:strand:- start:2743 stop:3258 length:516 start_codon:yes stop_codon:yes gene_type:complete
MVKLLRPLPYPVAGIGVLVLGIMWSLGSGLANWDQLQAAELPMVTTLLLVTVGGTLTVAGVWFGVSAVGWAMGRLLGGKARFVKVLFAISTAAPPLWLAAPAVPLTLAAGASTPAHLLLILMGAAGVLGFMVLLVAELRELEGFSRLQAWGWAALTIVFCASFLSLQNASL